MPLWLWIGVAVLIAGLLCVAYGVFVERTWFRLGRYRLDILPAGSEGTVSVLHLSDLHVVRRDRRKLAFLRSLPPADLTVITGDVLGEPEAVEVAVRALRPLRGRLASYVVLGSNDYFAPRPLNYLAYFAKRRKRRVGIRGRSGDLLRLLEEDGWELLRNVRAEAALDGAPIEVVGMDDPHIHRHDLRVARRRSPGRFGLAFVHAPDPAPELAALGWDLILSGHTHGGQVRLPVVGALVSNSTIPTRLCMGLSSLGRSFLHVSPGLGTSKYAPFRFLCRPEATLLELRPAPASGPAEPLH
jgi:predicted MPP superfamily phosphohydrolase